MRYRISLLLVLIPLLTPSLHAGFLFGRKKDKIDPKQRVPELILVLKSDKDADKRSQAAEELRNYDPAQFPAIIPALIDALQNDPKPSVRVDALQSLTKFRPVSQPVGDALEQSQSRDASMRVRLQARSASLQYYWAGYRSTKKPEPGPLNPSREPSVAGSGKFPPDIDTSKGAELRPIAAPKSPYASRPLAAVSPPNVTTKEPPLAPPLPPPPAQLTPLPTGPTSPSPVAAPVAPSISTTEPPSVPEGPALAAPEGPTLSATPSPGTEQGPKLP